MMKTLVITLFMLHIFMCPFYVIASDSIEDGATPMEQDDMKTIDQIKGGNPIEDGSTPIEQDDMKTIDQINGENSIEDWSTPIEQDDMKTIDQLNQ